MSGFDAQCCDGHFTRVIAPLQSVKAGFASDEGDRVRRTNRDAFQAANDGAGIHIQSAGDIECENWAGQCVHGCDEVLQVVGDRSGQSDAKEPVDYQCPV